MEIIEGKKTLQMDAAGFARRLDGRREIWMDIGTGDGRFVRHVAELYPEHFVIGIDACRENLCAISRRVTPNTLYVIANAQALPAELYGLATHLTINFPWGSLLAGLLSGDSGLIESLRAISRPEARIEVRLTADALAQAGWSLDDGGKQVYQVLRAGGLEVSRPSRLDAQALRVIPTTWARRLAFGRDPRASCLGAAIPKANQELPECAKRPPTSVVYVSRR